MLKKVFFRVLDDFVVSTPIKDQLWEELLLMYNEKHRAYHNLSHLQAVYGVLEGVRNEIKDWNTLLMGMFYHDVVYNPSNQNNEELSAELAKKRLMEIDRPTAQIQKCYEQIIATKSHELATEHDTNLFTDADLSILGGTWHEYEKYTQQIRLEYSVYPDSVYQEGRKKVLLHFLSMDNLYKTEVFREKYEQQSKLNLERELGTL